jgi:hypothetical protein
MRPLCRDPGARANLGDSRFAVIVNNKGCLERRARSKAKCGSKTPGFAMARCQKWNLFAEVEARGNDASDQPRTAIEGEVLDRSLDKNQNHLWNVTRYVRRMKAQTSHAGKPEIWHRKPAHLCRAANHGKRSFVEVAKRAKLAGLRKDCQNVRLGSPPSRVHLLFCSQWVRYLLGTHP